MRRLVLLVLLSTLMACVPEETPSTPTPAREIDAKDPCSLLSPEQVEVAIGTPVRDEREVEARDLVTRICHYETTEPYGSVDVVVRQHVSQDEFETRVNRDPANAEVLDGVGDGAYIHACVSLEMLVKETVVSISVQHFTTCEKTEVVLRALAGEALSELT